jgi:hypothetical protein
MIVDDLYPAAGDAAMPITLTGAVLRLLDMACLLCLMPILAFSGAQPDHAISGH